MKAKRKRRMSRRRRERTYIAVMVLLAIAVSIGLTRSVMRDDKEFEEYEQQSQELNARMQRIDEKREASGQNAILEQVRTWQQEQDAEPDKYAVFDTMSADWGGEEDGFVLYEIPEEYSRTGGYFPEKMQVYTYCVCKQYGVRYDLVVALIEKESGYKFDKVGDDGHSIGYMQIYEECHRDRITATEYIEQLRINGLSCGEITIDTIPRGATVIIDGETGFATMDGENKFKDVSLMEFPYLTTGQEKEHHLIFSDNNALVTLQYKPMWL